MDIAEPADYPILSQKGVQVRVSPQEIGNPHHVVRNDAILDLA